MSTYGEVHTHSAEVHTLGQVHTLRDEHSSQLALTVKSTHSVEGHTLGLVHKLRNEHSSQ